MRRNLKWLRLLFWLFAPVCPQLRPQQNQQNRPQPQELVVGDVGDDCPQLLAPQIITHLKRLRDVSGETEYLFKTLSLLNRKLGPVLFQFPQNFRANRPVLEDFLAIVPRHASCAFEFRHPSWLDDEFLDLLHEREYSLCIADSDDNPAQGIIHTAPWGYLRLRRADYTETDLSQWLERILSQQWQRAFVFFKHECEAKGPEMAVRFRELTDLEIKRIQAREDNATPI